jgi:hypothetical protein
MSDQDSSPLFDSGPGQEQPPIPVPPTTEPAGRWRLYAVLAILVVGAAIAGFLLLRDGGEKPAAGPEPAQPKVVTTFSGSGNKRTEPFNVDSGWEIRWKTEGKRFAVAVSGAENLGTVIEQRGKQTGATFPRGAGKFRLKITAKGPWRIDIRNHPASTPQP